MQIGQNMRQNLTKQFAKNFNISKEYNYKKAGIFPNSYS